MSMKCYVISPEFRLMAQVSKFRVHRHCISGTEPLYVVDGIVVNNIDEHPASAGKVH